MVELKKPDNHNDPNGYEFYWMKCSAEEADNIASYLFEAEALAVPKNGETTTLASRYASLVDIWVNFKEWLENGGDVEPHW